MTIVTILHDYSDYVTFLGWCNHSFFYLISISYLHISPWFPQSQSRAVQAPTFAIWAMEIHALGPPGPLRVLKENQQEPVHGWLIVSHSSWMFMEPPILPIYIYVIVKKCTNISTYFMVENMHGDPTWHGILRRNAWRSSSRWSRACQHSPATWLRSSWESLGSWDHHWNDLDSEWNIFYGDIIWYI